MQIITKKKSMRIAAFLYLLETAPGYTQGQNPELCVCVREGNVPSAPVTSLNSSRWLQGRLPGLAVHGSALM